MLGALTARFGADEGARAPTGRAQRSGGLEGPASVLSLGG
jgi:hypothetical protein